MCGINGFNFSNIDLIKQMSAFTFSRGPDNQDFFVNNDYSVGHNRLSIIDTNKRSNQPFFFKNYILSFNGEIYNYKELRKDLISLGYKFETTSDTEVIIKLFDRKGINSFKDLSGIFALSIYDTKIKKLYLIRDIMGVKPLYYYHNSSSKKFFYSSLIKGILLSCEKRLNKDAIFSYANFNRNDFRETFFKDIYKVLPGELIEVFNGEYKRSKILNFNFKKKIVKSNLPKDISNYFSKQFLSDVPVALSLSGGVDSNIIFQELLKNKGTSFANYSVRFKNSLKYNKDHDIAEQISKKNGIKFNSIVTDYNDFQDKAEEVVDIVEEPVGNTNSIANLIVSENVSEKVLFSGDGGDEVFTGYDKYKSIHLLSFLLRINFIKKLKTKFKSKMMKRLFLKNSRQLFLSFSEQNLFKNQKKIYKNFKFFLENDLDHTLNHSKNFNDSPILSNVMYHDLDTWVVNDILNRNDKIYGNKGIEVRVPFLDKNIINSYLMANGLQKYGFFLNYKNLINSNFKNQLKDILKEKSGFDSPFAGWLRVELHEFAKNILSKEYYDSSEHIDLQECQLLLKKHKDEYFDPFLIWNIISLQIFLRKFKF